MENKDYKELYNIAIELLSFLALTWVAQWIWNEFGPDLFGAPHITYWQMMGLKIFANFFLHKTNYGTKSKS